MVKKLGLLLILIVFALTNNAFSQEKTKEISVIATGTGIDSNSATKNAIRAAVEQAVGAYISSETITKNRILLDDKIFMFSEGYVEKMKIISTRNEGGLVHVKIEALVVGDKLKQKLQQLGIATAKLEGESLFGEAFSKEERKQNKADFLLNSMKAISTRGFLVQVGSSKVINTQGTKAAIEVPFSVKWNPSYVEEMRNTCSKIALESNMNLKWDRTWAERGKGAGISFTSNALSNQFMILQDFGISERANNWGKKGISAWKIFLDDEFGIRMYLTDENKQTIWIAKHFASEMGAGALSFLGRKLFFEPGSGCGINSACQATLITDGIWNETMKTEVEMDVLKEVKYVQVKIVNRKNE